MHNLIRYIISNVIVAFTITIVVNNIIKSKVKLGVLPCIFIINFIVFHFTFYSKPYIAMPLSLIFTAGVLYIFSKDIFKAAVTALITTIILAISDLISGVIIMSVFMYNNSTLIEENIRSYLSLYLVMLIVSYIISALLGKLLLKIKSFKAIRGYRYKVRIIFYTIFTVAIFYLNSIIYRYYPSSGNKIFIILNMLLFSLYFLWSIINMYLSVKNANRRIIYENRLNEIERCKESSFVLDSVIKDINKISFDYKIIMLHMEKWDKEGNGNCFSDLDIDKINSENKEILKKYRDLYTMQKVGVDEVRGLLFSKIMKAQLNEIAVQIDIPKEINDVFMDTMDFCIIAGLFFDNSIEMASKAENKKIIFGIIQNDECILMVVSNSIRMESESKAERSLYEEEKIRGENLDIVNEIIHKKYSNILLNTSLEGGEYRQDLIIYKK